MADESDTPPKPVYMEDLSCREVYAETVQTLFGLPGTLRVELCVNRWTQQTPIRIDRIVPVCRFVLPFGLAKMLRDQLTASLELAEKQGSTLEHMPAASPAKN